MALHGDVDQIRVTRIDSDLRNLAPVLQPAQLPGRAGVGRLVQAHAGLDVAPEASRTGTDVHDLGIRVAHGDCADRRRCEVLVGQVFPDLAVVDGLPDAAA